MSPDAVASSGSFDEPSPLPDAVRSTLQGLRECHGPGGTAEQILPGKHFSAQPALVLHWNVALDNLFCYRPGSELQPGNCVKLVGFCVHKVLAGKLWPCCV